MRVSSPNWLRKTLSGFAALFAISNYTKQLLVQWGASDEKTVIVHPPLAPDLVKQFSSQKTATDLGYQADHPRLLTIARLVERKGIQTVLEAVKKMERISPTLHYDIVGDGPYRPELELLSDQLGISNRVTFHGFLDDRARNHLLKNCDIFVMPAFEDRHGDIEGFGIAFLEAGLFGKPVIGSYSGGIPDAILQGQTGLLIQPQNSNELVNAIKHLWTNPHEMQSMTEAGWVWAVEHFPQELAQIFLNVFDENRFG